MQRTIRGLMSWIFGDLVVRPRFAFALVLLPLAAFGASHYILQQAGVGFGWMPTHFAEVDPSRAEALRLAVYGAFLLFGACAAAALLYFLFTLRLLRARHGLVLLAFFMLANLAFGHWLMPRASSQADGFVRSGLVCAALGYNASTSAGWARIQEKEQVKVQLPPDSERKGIACDSAREDMNWLLKLNKWGVLLGLMSLVIGSILCLAGPADDARWSVSRAVAHYEEQSERLNTYLYLSALLLVTGLLFISAVFRWPTHALLPGTSYEAHADALTAYYGFSYTIVIAAFYIPVAVILSARVKALKPAKEGAASGVPDAFTGPLQVLKIATAIFSTSLAGIVSGLTSLG